MTIQQAYNEFIKVALFGLVGWIALQVTDLKQGFAGLTATVITMENVVKQNDTQVAALSQDMAGVKSNMQAGDVHRSRIADAVVRLMGADTEQQRAASDVAQRVSKLEAKLFR